MFYQVFAGLCALGLIVGLVRLAHPMARRTGPHGVWRPLTDGAVLLVLLPVALFAVRPYLGANLIGAGDSYHYALQVADFVTQSRQGILPVLIGQSDYAFNGNAHTVRTAPYFTHLAGLLDFLTGQRLSFVSLQNLTVALTSVLAAWAAYAACLLASGGRKTAAGLLASVYVLSPAVLGPLAVGDMFATYMTAPWLVLCWLGIAGILDRENATRSQVLAAGALAMTWYAHPPIAAWLSMGWVLAQIARFLLAAGKPRQWLVQLAPGLLLLAGLGAYAFTSIGTLGTGNFGNVDFASYAYTPDRLRQILTSGFLPFTHPTGAGLQLGWSLWLLLLVAGGLLIRARHLTGLLLLGSLALLCLYLFPLPGLSDSPWHLLPRRLVALTNWPAQRLYPLLAAGAIVVIAIALRREHLRAAFPYWAWCLLLGAGSGWSLLEAAAIHRRTSESTTPPAVQAIQFAPENLILTRYSYALSPRLPTYFTHGWTDPEFESRLLDRNLDLAQDYTLGVLGRVAMPEMKPLADRITMDVPGPSRQLLLFSFARPDAVGELKIQGGGVNRFYALPRSGEVRAFGAGPAAGKTIPLAFSRPGPHQVTVHTSAPGLSMGILPVDPSTLPVRLLGLAPYTARVNAAQTGYLETPLIHLDGYEAEIDGNPAAVRPSPDGLVMVPVPAGTSTVTIRYPGPPLLRGSWLLSLACLALFPWLLRLRAGPEDSPSWMREHNLIAGVREAWRRQPRRVLLTAGTICLLAVAAVISGLAWRDYRSYGALRLMLELPKHPPTKSEPLLTLGQTGAADCVFVIYEDASHIRLGLDHWGYGGPVSEPIAITPGELQVIEISLGGLHPPSPWFSRHSPVAGQPAPFVLKLNDQVVFRQNHPFHPAKPSQVAVGTNPAGNTVALSSFTGRIISVERLRETDLSRQHP
jgi:hypothetical protein